MAGADDHGDADLPALLRAAVAGRERAEADVRELAMALDLLVQMLTARGSLTDSQRKILARASVGARRPPERVHLRQVADKYEVVNADIDCASLIHLCHGRCCSFRVELSQQDLDEDAVRPDPNDPGALRRGLDGYCVHVDRDSFGCTVHAQRPANCRSYDCRHDPRVWIDFAAKIPAPLR